MPYLCEFGIILPTKFVVSYLPIKVQFKMITANLLIGMLDNSSESERLIEEKLWRKQVYIAEA